MRCLYITTLIEVKVKQTADFISNLIGICCHKPRYNFTHIKSLFFLILQEMIARFATTLHLPPDLVSDALEHLRIHTLEKLQVVERFSKSGIATVKVHFTGNIPFALKSKIHLQTGLHVSGADFRRRYPQIFVLRTLDAVFWDRSCYA